MLRSVWMDWTDKIRNENVLQTPNSADFYARDVPQFLLLIFFFLNTILLIIWFN